MAISCIFATYWQKIANFFVPHLYVAPPQGDDPVKISWRCLMLVKLEWLGYRMVKKKLWRYVKPFSSDTERYGQTDRRTDGRTDRIAISISRVSVLTRDKNLVTSEIELDLEEEWIVDSDRSPGRDLLVEPVQYSQRNGWIHDFSAVISIHPSHALY